MAAKRRTQKEQREVELYWSGVNWIAEHRQRESDDRPLTNLIAHMFGIPAEQVLGDALVNRRLFDSLESKRVQ